MAVEIIRGLWVCVDCLMFHANGPDDLEPEVVGRIVAGCEREAPYHWASDGRGLDEPEGADEQEFSWRPCACCHSSLGGSRHRFALIKHT